MNDTPQFATATALEADWHNDPNLKEKWKFRFSFFEKYGTPELWSRGTPELRAAFKQLPFGDRMKVIMNWYAFFFGFIYYAFFLKLWRQVLILIGIALAYTIIAAVLGLPHSVNKGASAGFTIFCALRANTLYYFKRTRGDIGWKI
jgi:hypothetical protein